MAQKVMAMDIRAATAFVGQIDNVAQFCRDQQISRQTFYKWRRRFGDEGLDGLEERSRCLHSSPGQTAAEVEEAVLRKRKQLLEAGLDHGPQSITWTLQREKHPQVPSRATVWRILTRHGVIVPQPHKRPKSATKRFCFRRPNECWQSDWTQWMLADGTAVAIAGTLDDHSRYLNALQADIGHGTAELVWSTMVAGITECGVPAMSLTDNGLVYTGRWKGYETSFEANLRALGTRTINSSPFHPQTCGKIERFWQTLKKWLRARPAPATINELNGLLSQFRDFYNHHRPHRALRGATPAEAFNATAKAHPAEHPLPAPVFVSRHSVDEQSGNLYVAPYRIGIGLRWAGHSCDVIRQGEHIAIFSGTTLIRELTADPTRYHQRCAPNTRTYRIREPKPAS
ncbi:IS481 family transposase [Mycolicibacterium sp. GF69]|uniref:integrase core domain-containing protein n=1 Tax=Mycolicibacterium sp. GF69 TaxID=2267251 RepID=UPI000DCB8277|nr:integrase core domain-containing protein [Mycolicibacterium sp. GF69]RAV05271.1 IS481 family transposase [Mycolicibacterium sp. GF69]